MKNSVFDFNETFDIITYQVGKEPIDAGGILL